MACATREAGTAYTSGSPEFIRVFRIAQALVLCVVFYRSIKWKKCADQILVQTL